MKDLNRKANSLFCIFRAVDPFVKCFLFRFYCLSLYGCSLWSLSSSSIKLAEVALKKSLRKLWHLPRNSHSTQWRSQGGAKGAIAPPFFKENALGVEQSVTS